MKIFLAILFGFICLKICKAQSAVTVTVGKVTVNANKTLSADRTNIKWPLDQKPGVMAQNYYYQKGNGYLH